METKKTTKTDWPLISPAAKRYINEFFSPRGLTGVEDLSFNPWSETTSYTEAGYKVMEVAVPGLSKDELNVTYNDYDGMVTITGQSRTTENKVERRIKQVVYIGSEVDDQLIETTLEDGILKIKYKETEERAPKKLKIG